MTANELADNLEKIQNNRENIDWYVLEFVVFMLRKQHAEIEALRKFKAEIDAENKKLFESVQKANAMWGRATGVKNERK